jgi:hypothetical protein
VRAGNPVRPLIDGEPAFRHIWLGQQDALEWPFEGGKMLQRENRRRASIFAVLTNGESRPSTYHSFDRSQDIAPRTRLPRTTKLPQNRKYPLVDCNGTNDGDRHMSAADRLNATCMQTFARPTFSSPQASGLRLTEESVLGFPTSSAYASLVHAHRDFPHSRLLRPPSS